ncbi:MAG: Lrp/AsnC ligand binding domain-containing protein [Bacteroidota bacterium]
MSAKLDKTDFQILSLLSQDAQMPYTEVAKHIGVSSGTIHGRVKKLKDIGVIKGTTLSMDYAKMGWKLTMFIGVFLNKSSSYEKLIEVLSQVPEVVKIHHITGRYGVFIKVHAKDAEHFKTVYQNKILVVKGVKRTETFMSLEECLNRHILFE